MNASIYGYESGMRNTLTILCHLFLLVFFISPAIAVQVQGEELTAREVMLLDPVCKLIIVDKPLCHLDIGQKTNADLFNRPEYRMAKNADWLHHRCWGITSKFRYLSARDSSKKKYYSIKFHQDYRYVFNNASPTWEYLPQVYIEAADMYMLEHDITNALGLSIKALAKDPDYAQAYALQVQAYSELGDKKKAMAAAIEGLKRNPTNRLLQRKYLRLGGKEPFPAPYVKQPLEIKAPEVKPESISDNPLPSSSPKATETGTQTSQETTFNPPKDTNISNKNLSKQKPTNPYCRFCP